MSSSDPHHSPTVRRRRLSDELIALREKRGLSVEEAAKRLGKNRHWLTRLENGSRKFPYLRDVEALLDLYEVGQPQRDALLDLTRQARVKGWWTKYRDVLDGYVGLEAGASRIWTYQSQVIPGLLQTERYAQVSARAALNAADEVERTVSARMRRQEILRSQRPPHLWAVIDEAVLARGAGSEVMREQIEHLLSAVEGSSHITVQVLPFSAGPHAAMSGPFVILDFPSKSDPSVVYLEARHDSLYLEEPEVVEEYRTTYGHVQGAALSPAESVSYLSRMIE